MLVSLDKATQPFRQALSPMAILLWPFLLLACGPVGQVKRTIHPIQHLSLPVDADHSKEAHTQRKKSGLPDFCAIASKTAGQFCISCREGENDIERCYLFQGTLDSAKSCVYSSDSIKCLNGKPPFALTLAIKGSLEKVLLENTRYWKEGLLTIALPHLDAQGTEELKAALSWTEQLVRLLTRANKHSQWIDNELSSTWARFKGPPNAQDALKKSLIDLQHDKEFGQLRLQKILSVSRAILEATGTSPNTLGYWGALSIEGLEDPGN